MESEVPVARGLTAAAGTHAGDVASGEGISEMGMREIGLLVAVVVLWFVLSRWVLPWFGVRT